MISLVRCDDRLIHGQCIVRVVADFGIRHIVVVDEFVAGNPVLKSIFMMAAPEGVKVDIETAEDAAKNLDEYESSTAGTLILMKSPEVALELYERCPNLKKELNIGPMSNRPNTKKATMYCYLTDSETAAVEKLCDLGVRVYFNQVTDQKTVEWKEIKENL